MEKDIDLNGSDVAILDVDITSSYGPETVTIFTTSGLKFNYAIHDYSNRYSNNSNAMANSSAKVTVYKGNTLVRTFNVPSNKSGTVWHVFNIINGEIIPVNTVGYESDPRLVR